MPSLRRSRVSSASSARSGPPAKRARCLRSNQLAACNSRLIFLRSGGYFKRLASGIPRPCARIAEGMITRSMRLRVLVKKHLYTLLSVALRLALVELAWSPAARSRSPASSRAKSITAEKLFGIDSDVCPRSRPVRAYFTGVRSCNACTPHEDRTAIGCICRRNR